jgi:hypothetical protein
MQLCYMAQEARLAGDLVCSFIVDLAQYIDDPQKGGG